MPAALAFALLAGCASEAPKEVAKKAEPPVPVTGQKAAFEMYKVARAWAPDVAVLRLESADLSEVKAEPGKHGVWMATFVSLTQKMKRDYSYSVVEANGLRKGAYPGVESSYMPNPQIRPLNISAIRVDTPDVLTEAMKQKEIAEFAGKHPELPVNYLLEWSISRPHPDWRAYWGPTVATSQASVYVDADTGAFVKKSH